MSTYESVIRRQRGACRLDVLFLAMVMLFASLPAQIAW
jgi:hypothetical protein